MSPPNDDRRPGRGSGGHVEAGQADAVSVADPHVFALEHVERIRARCPEFVTVDVAVWVALVEAHLQPLDPNRSWLRRRWSAPRSELVCVGGLIGLHRSVSREPA